MSISSSDLRIRTQSSLGTEYQRNYKDSSNIDKIIFATVTRVNYRYNTVDVSSTGGDFGSSSGGRMAAKLPVQFSGTTKEGKAFGQVNPVQVGTRVLIGFVKGEKTTPVVLGIYGNESETEKLSRTPFEGSDPLDSDLEQLTQQQFTVHPSLTYENIDGLGNRTVSFTGKSFVTTEAGANPEVGGVNDNESGTHYDELESSYYYTGELIEPKENKAPVILFKHQGDKFARNGVGYEESNHTFMWFLDDDGTYRTSLMQEDEDWRAYFEMTPDGKIQMVRQNDTKRLNTSSDRYSVGVEPEGIRFRVGNKYSLITPDGTYGNLGLGSGGGGSGGSGLPGAPGADGTIPEDLLDRIEGIIDEGNRNIIKMGTYFERTDAFIAMGADLLEEIEGDIVEYKADFSILAEEIRLAVSETRLKDLLNDELNAFMGDIDDINKEAQEQLEIIKGFVDDGRLTPAEKLILIPGYQNIKIEFPGYMEQAEKNDRDSKRYERAYNRLRKIMDPIFEDSSITSEVDPLEVNEAYAAYYNARQELISGILYELQRELRELAEETSKIAEDATNALSDSGTAIDAARKALSSLKSIADSNEATPQEKRVLQRELNQIKNEYKQYLEQAEAYEVDTVNYQEAYRSLIDFIETSGVLDYMDETTDVEGQKLYDFVEDYYKEKIRIITAIAKETSKQLKGLQTNFEHFSTEIVETSREIALIAKSVIANEKSINVSIAKFSVMADRISSKVTKTSFKREVEENRNTLNATGRNLFVESTAQKDVVLNTEDGTTKASKDGLTSVYIGVNSGTLYTGSVFENVSNNVLTIAYYDTKHKFVGFKEVAMSSGEEHVEVIAPSSGEAKYARISIDNNKRTRVQFERGSGSGFFMNSNEDLINDLGYATEEKRNREIAWKDKNTRMIKFSGESSDVITGVEDRIRNLKLSQADAIWINTQITNLEKGYTEIVTEGLDLDIQTINVEFAMRALKTTAEMYIDPIATNGDGVLSELERAQVSKRFTEYLDTAERYYKQVDSKYKISYEASVEILDDVLAGSLEAERIAREAAIAAENAAQSVSTLEYQMGVGNEMEARHLKIVKRISLDGVIEPLEKEEGITLVNEIIDEIDWLIAQGKSIGLSTNDLENVAESLISYFTEIVAPAKMLDNTPVNPQTFVDRFQRYHSTKLVFIANLLDEAKDNLKRKDKDAQTARDETLRRDNDLQRIKNIIDDSELAIERIESKIEMLENTHAYVIEIMSTNGFTFKDRIIDTTLRVTVRQGTEDITENIAKKDFEWTKTLKDGSPDTVWNSIHKEIGREFELTHEDIQGRATFTVEVYLNKEEK